MRIKVRIGNTAFVVDQIQREDLVCLEYSETQSAYRKNLEGDTE